MEGREWEGTGGPRNIRRAGEGEGQAGTAPAGSPGSALVACLSPGLGLWAETPPTRPQLRAHGAWVSRLRQLCRRILLGTPSPPRVFCHQAHSPEPHPSPSARLPQRQGQIPGRCPGVRGTVCLWGRALPRALLLHACVFSPEPGSACTPLWTFQDAQLLLILGHWSLPCHWPRLHPPPPTHIPLMGPCSSSCLQNDWLPFPLPVLCQERFLGKKKETWG